MERYPPENANAHRRPDDTEEAWQCATPDSLASSLAEETPTLQPPGLAPSELSRLPPEQQLSELSMVTGPSTTAPGPSQYEPNFQLVPVAANQAHEELPQHEVFHTANAFFHPAHVYAVPLRLVHVRMVGSTPQPRASRSMFLPSDTATGDLGTCALVSALGLLAGLLVFYFVFRLTLSASQGSETTSEAVARVGIVFRRPEPHMVGRLPRHGREELRVSNQSDSLTVTAAVTTEDVLDNEVAGERTAVATSKETAQPWQVMAESPQ